MEHNRMKRQMGRWFFLSLALVVCFFGQKENVQAKTSVRASVPTKSLKVGNRMQVRAQAANVRFSSSDSMTASVDSQGIITGKKEGKVTIYVKRRGYKTKKLALSIKKSAGKPASLPVSFSELSLTGYSV